jgi:hypothetical protein
MTMSPRISTINHAQDARPTVHLGDDRQHASAVLNQVLQRTLALQDELRAIANRHVDDAPASYEHVLDLTGVLASAVLDWIQRWPE